jgi:PIN domain nuclease of toxin-antitoxin system
MRLLLDTHVYLWCVNDNRLLSKEARKLISEATEVYVSTASIWEAAIKIKLKKLNADLNELINAIPESGFLELPILMKHIVGINHLSDVHRDPFDRILVSQAINEPLRLLTSDSILTKYSELVELV